jgi:DNA-binding HxlR family transcriptional regulator
MQQAQLRRETGSPAQTTLRTQLKRLVETGVISKHRRDRFPGVLEYELEDAGRDLLSVAAVVESWLGDAPGDPLHLGDNPAKATVNALAEAWSTTMLRALAARPLSLTELDGLIGSLSYPALERRLGSMRLAGLVELRPGNGRGNPYAVTDWLRRGVAPVAAASRWELLHQSGTAASIGPLDAETAFLLAVPLLHLPREISGTCRMVAEITNGNTPRLAGVTVEVGSGRIASCATRLEGRPDAWSLGSPTAWLEAITERETDRLQVGGDCDLARSLLDHLHKALFQVRERI